MKPSVTVLATLKNWVFTCSQLAGKVKGVVPGAVMIAEQYWVRPAKQLLMLVPVETVVI